MSYAKDIYYLKDVIFIKSLVYTYSLSIFVLIPGVIYGISIDNFGVVFWDIFAYVVIFVLTYPTKIKLIIRKWIFILTIYLLGFQLLYELGMDGAGILFWVIGNITCSLIFSKKQFFLIITLNTLVLLFIAYIIYFDLTKESFSTSLNFDDWMMITINIVYLSILIASVLNELLNVLQRVLNKEQKLQSSIKYSAEQIEQSNKLLEKKNTQLEQIAFVTAKDLKEPLKIVAENLNYLTRNLETSIDEKGSIYLYYANEGAERMTMLIDGMVKLAKIDQHKMEINEFNLGELIFEIFRKKNTNTDRANLRVVIPDAQFINDKQLITKLLSIFISNGFNYRKKSTELNLQINLIEANDDMWELSFRDNGIGIEDIYFDRIFQMFQRLHKQNEYPGQGIGLALAKRIVTKLNGQIHVNSTKNVGTTFSVLLPKNN